MTTRIEKRLQQAEAKLKAGRSGMSEEVADYLAEVFSGPYVPTEPTPDDPSEWTPEALRAEPWRAHILEWFGPLEERDGEWFMSHKGWTHQHGTSKWVSPCPQVAPPSQPEPPYDGPKTNDDGTTR